MSAREQLIKARWGMLALADELKNIAKACRMDSVSMSQPRGVFPKVAPVDREPPGSPAAARPTG